MTYVYDILLNFNDTRIYEFFEWDIENDLIDHIKKIPLYRISNNVMDDFINNSFSVTCDFLNKIKGKTVVYKNKNIILYGCLFCDLNRVLAVEFSDLGKCIYKSYLIIDEEDDVCSESVNLEEYIIDYKVFNKVNYNNYLTRLECMKRNYLIHEVNTLYKEKNIDKMNYLYLDIFNKIDDFDEEYNNLLNEIENNYNYKFNNLYDTLKLSIKQKISR